MRALSLLTVSLVFATAASGVSGAPSRAEKRGFSGATALAFTRKATAFGERPSGSPALAQTRSWIMAALKPLGGALSLDEFTAQTPAGPVPMTNILLEFAGTSGKTIVVSGHYDTKRIPMVHFVGANDAGSSTGFLLELAHAAAHTAHQDTLLLVFLDGEEAVNKWSNTDSCYGSRHLAAKWLANGALARVKALINVDMIGDSDLKLSNDSNSSEALRADVTSIAARLGYQRFLRTDEGAIEDDHKPFADLGVNVIDLIDLDYGSQNAYWHTAQDTVDKLSAHSFQVTGDIVLALIDELAGAR